MWLLAPPTLLFNKNYPGSINLILWLYSDDGNGFIRVNTLIHSEYRQTDLNSKAISSSKKKKKKTKTDKSLTMNLVKLILLLRILNEQTDWPWVFSVLYVNLRLEEIVSTHNSEDKYIWQCAIYCRYYLLFIHFTTTNHWIPLPSQS